MNYGNDGTYHFLVQIGLIGRLGKLQFRELLKRARHTPEMKLRLRNSDSFRVGRVVCGLGWKLKTELRLQKVTEPGIQVTMCRFQHI